MAAKKKTAKAGESSGSSPAEYVPSYGEIVTIEILEGHRVRCPFSKRPLETGAHVTYSTYYARRLADGGVRFRPMSEEV